MAHLRIDGLDETIRGMEKLGRMDEIAPKAVEEAVPYLEQSMKAQVLLATTGRYGTGELVGSIKATKVKQNQYGYYSVVRPTGKDKRGTSNAEKLVNLEYGNSHQIPRPSLQKAVDKVEDTCIDVMEEVIAREVGAE